MKSIWRNCGPLDQNNHRALGLTRCDKKSGRIILEKDEYDLIGLKRNQKTLSEKACQRFGIEKIHGRKPVWESEVELGPGRVEERSHRDVFSHLPNDQPLYLLGQRHLKPDEDALCWQLRSLGFITYSLPPRSEIDRSQLREQHGAIRPS